MAGMIIILSRLNRIVCKLYPYRVVFTKASMVLYGHTARIWDAMIIPTGIVSVGEVKDVTNT